MQAGFAMCETGFTRAKNAGNIIMKNLMDFCIGTVVFSLLGYSLMMGRDAFHGLIGLPNLSLFTRFGDFIASPADGGFTGASTFVFNLVFCATTATIVSGAMAERTKFSAYCLYSAVISLLVYPIEAHWIWGGGWLSQRGFHDYAGSCAIHMVGGIAALVGAIFLGPRIGKYIRDERGKVVKVNAIPGHSIPLSALGVFILWLGWYGFNGAAAATPSELASIFLTTTIAPSVATCTTMCYTWIKNGKPDVSMCLNASLAGLVGITAGCDAVDAIGAAVIGAVSGVLVVAVVETLDLKLHIDDPVGAVGVHMANGVWGTIAVGLLANPAAPAGLQGLFYTG
ncbi:MAG: ammonium transporter, partial [Oscillibacter sp.]|nr:ammonium transporter [Oscillibacter sp.]